MSYLEAITDDDRLYVKRYILLPLIIAAFERDCRYIQQNLKTPEPYIDTIKSAINKAHDDFKEIKKYFWLKGLKVYEEIQTRNGILAKFKCRGYQSDMELHWEFITAQASILMRKYLGLDISHYEVNHPNGITMGY
ncbi:hypothetical protein [Paenibacillus sp. FSL R5-808]|jgi:hypothetical protein|uniref:hypothetical protein n=1 Tax=unclassified Paenibacillus TaxID=185978 RepID=UPI0003E20317|nr:hypothetical protein [Paenibacillus sp. FSL R5-808]ETT32116.1 hypothetical protein C169_23940 [Paenibacillus sp. FSL R5-808]